VNAIKTGDLVRMKTHDTGLIGVVLHIHGDLPRGNQIGIKWFTPARPLLNWEPEGWLEVVSESR
jgi:hypothetical protein